MPLYEYICPDCDETDYAFRAVTRRDDPLYCLCDPRGGIMQRVLTPAHLHGSPNMPNG